MTEQQLALVDVPAVPDLTPRQQHALELVQAAGANGMHADELGALLHAEYRKHGADERCTWCGSTGNSILKALRKKRLVRYRRGTPARPGYWEAVNVLAAASEPSGEWDGRGPVPYGVIPY